MKAKNIEHHFLWEQNLLPSMITHGSNTNEEEIWQNMSCILIKLKTKYFYHMFVYIWESKLFRWQEKYFDVRFDNTWCACIQDKVLIIGNENEN